MNTTTITELDAPYTGLESVAIGETVSGALLRVGGYEFRNQADKQSAMNAMGFVLISINPHACEVWKRQAMPRPSVDKADGSRARIEAVAAREFPDLFGDGGMFASEWYDGNLFIYDDYGVEYEIDPSQDTCEQIEQSF